MVDTPGPGSYGVPRPKSAPSITISSRHPTLQETTSTPGPGTYNTNMDLSKSGITFSGRHDQNKFEQTPGFLDLFTNITS